MPLSDKMPSEAQSVSDGIFMGSIYYLRRNDAARVLLVVIWHQNKKPALKEKKAVLRGCLFGWYHSTTILGNRLLKSLPLSAMLRAIWNAASV